MKSSLYLGAFLLVAATLPAQVSVTVAPPIAPVGCPIAISIANDTPSAIFLPNPCPFQVVNQSGSVIYNPICIQIIVNINPGAVFTTYWDQTDNNGAQVPPGFYLVQVFGPAPMNVLIMIDATEDFGIGQLGVNKPGTTRNLYLCAPQDGVFAYAMAVSGPVMSGGIPTCGGAVPLENDALLALSIGPNPFFLNFTGTLGPAGTSTAPSINVPNIPGLSGASFYVAGVVIDPLAPCVVRSISLATFILIP